MTNYDGPIVAFDAIHHAVHTQAPWPLAQRVLAELGEPADLVLIAVPAGTGPAIAAGLANNLTVEVEGA